MVALFLSLSAKGWAQFAAASNSGPICAGSQVSLFETGIGSVTWQWSSNGPAVFSSTTAQNPTATGVINGEIFTVVVTNLLGMISNATTTVQVDPVTIGGSVAGGTSICSGNTSGLLTLSGHTGVVLNWQSAVSPFTVWTDIPNTSTSYTSGALTQTIQFRAVVKSGSCIQAFSLPTTVTVAPTVGIPSAPTPSASTTCQGNTDLFTTSAVNATSYTWSVTGAGNTISGTGTAGTVTWSPSFTGSATVSVVANGCNGPSVPASTPVTVRPLPTATISGTSAICLNGAPPDITFTNPQTLPVIVTYDINGANQTTIPVGAGSTAIVTAPATVSGTFNYNLVSCVYQTAPACTHPISGTATVTVNPLPPATLSSSDPDNIHCAGTSVTFTAGGGTNYNFTVAGTSVQNGTLATYTTSTLTNGQVVGVTVTNAGGCSATLSGPSGIINFVNALPFIFVSSQPVCAVNLLTYSLSVTVNSGTVTSSSGTVTNTGSNVWSITGVLSGLNITVRVTDASGCENTVVVTAPTCSCSVVLAPVSGGDKSYCGGGTIPPLTATVMAGETIDWYGTSSGGVALASSSLSYTPTTSGTYYALARNTTTNCISSTRTPVTLTMNAVPVVSLTSSDPDNTFCSGTSVTFTAGGGTSYNFSVGSTSVQNGASATYTTTTLTNGQVVSVIVTNAAGCTATPASITNIVNTVPAANAGTGGNECDLNFTFSAIPGIGTGTWTLTSGPGTAQFAPNANSATATVTVSEYGTYTFTWTEVSGTCLRSSVITVNFYQQPVANAGTGGNNCGLDFNLTGTLNIGTGTWSKVSGPGNVVFSPGSTDPNALVTVSAYGNYTFRWTVFNGTCSNSSTVTVTFILQTPANAGTGGNECDKDFVLKAAAATGIGTWTKLSGPGIAVFTPDDNQPDALVNVDQVGTYDFAWTVVNSTCTSNDIVRVIFHDLPSVNAGKDTAICKSGSIQLNAEGSGIFAWVPAVTLNNADIASPIASPEVTTTYVVTLTDQFGCKNTDNIIVDVRLKPVANAGPDQILDYSTETTLDAQLASNSETGIWSLISGTGDIFDVTKPKTSVTGLSFNDNKFLWSVTNGVCPVSDDTVKISVNNFIIPTLITPNLDGFNDYFILRGLTTLGRTELYIFDRRGARVYKNLDYDNTWDGVDYNNNPLPDDTYFYVLKSENGKSVSGYIVIRR